MAGGISPHAIVGSMHQARIGCPVCWGCGVTGGEDCTTCGGIGTLGLGELPRDVPMDVARMIASRWMCKYCNVVGLITLHERIVTHPLGTWSLSGSQPKTSASKVLYARCGSCGHESRGK